MFTIICEPLSLDARLTLFRPLLSLIWVGFIIVNFILWS